MPWPNDGKPQAYRKGAAEPESLNLRSPTSDLPKQVQAHCPTMIETHASCYDPPAIQLAIA